MPRPIDLAAVAAANGWRRKPDATDLHTFGLICQWWRLGSGTVTAYFDARGHLYQANLNTADRRAMVRREDRDKRETVAGWLEAHGYLGDPNRSAT